MSMPLKVSTVSAYKFVVIPLFGLILTIALSLVLYNVGKDRISSQIAQIKTLESEVGVLDRKASILQDEKDILKLYGSPAKAVLPNSVPSLLVIYKIKKLAFDSNIQLKDLTVSTGLLVEEGYSSIAISFKLTGTTDEILNFFDKLQTQSPMTLIDKAEIKTLGDISDADVRALAYFSSLPDTLPSITSPITQLTRDEIDTLNSFIVSTDDNKFDLGPQNTKSDRNPFVF